MNDQSMFLRKFRRLRNIILDGISYFIVWELLDKEYSSYFTNISLDPSNIGLGPRKDFWQEYRGFFAPTRNALLWSALLQLSKAYDTDSRTASLNTLISQARNDPSITPYATQDDLEKIQARIAKNREILVKLRHYRNTRLVHYDSTEMENIRIPVYQVTSLFDETKEVFNSLKQACEGDTDDFDLYMEDVNLHTLLVIDTMKERYNQG